MSTPPSALLLRSRTKIGLSAVPSSRNRVQADNHHGARTPSHQFNPPKPRRQAKSLPMPGFARRTEGRQKGAEERGSRSIVFIENNSEQLPDMAVDEGYCQITERGACMHCAIRSTGGRA